MRVVFADTGYWIAVTNPKDQWAAAAQKLERTLSECRILTTDEILLELLGHFCELGPHLRGKAAEIVRAIHDDPNVTVVPQSRDGFLRGLKLYESRADKGYSLVDCVSMEVMRQHGLTEALSADRHFVQEGFVALLLQEELGA